MAIMHNIRHLIEYKQDFDIFKAVVLLLYIGLKTRRPKALIISNKN